MGSKEEVLYRHVSLYDIRNEFGNRAVPRFTTG